VTRETAAPAIAALAKDGRADVDEIVGMLTGNLEKIAEHGRRADGTLADVTAPNVSPRAREVDTRSHRRQPARSVRQAQRAA
jgi:hypothetical protein